MQPLKFLAEKFELVRGGTSGNLSAMEGTRGFAVFLVFMVHYTTMMAPWIEPGSWLGPFAVLMHEVGNTGVDLFFVLSGYLIYGTLISRQQDFTPYIKRRIRRIYPVYIAVFLLYTATSFTMGSENRISGNFGEAAWYLLKNFLLLPGLMGERPMISVSWSLSYEVLFYLAIPVLISALRLRERTLNFRLVFFAGVVGFVIAYSMAFGLHVRMMMFVAGIYLFELLRQPQPRQVAAWLGVAGLLAGMCAPLLPLSGFGSSQLQTLIIFGGFFLFCYSCYAAPQGVLARAFAWTPMRWLGNMSYSFYLLHGIATKVAIMVLAKLYPAAGHQADWVFWAMLPVALLAAILASAVLYLAIERPYSLLPAAKKPQPAGDILQPASGQ